MPSRSTKGLHRTVALIVGAQQRVGSFTKVNNFTATPDGGIKKSDHLGEPLSEIDSEHHGWNGSFGIEEEDFEAAKVYEEIAAASSNGTPLPRVDIVVIHRYVNPAVPTQTFTYQDAVLKLDSDESSGRKEYNKTMFSFAAKTRKRS